MSEQILNNMPVLIMATEPEKESEVRCLLATVSPIDITGGSRSYEYWLCDIILIPKKKYHKPKHFEGWRYSDILRDPAWPNPKNWEEKETEK